MKIEITKPIRTAISACVGVLTFYFLLLVVITIIDPSASVSPIDIRKACIQHKGVREVRSTSGKVFESGFVGITCRDGWYTTR